MNRDELKERLGDILDDAWNDGWDRRPTTHVNVPRLLQVIDQYIAAASFGGEDAAPDAGPLGLDG